MLAIEQHWYRRSVLSLVLLPLSWVYCALMSVRRALYRAGVLRRVRLPVPVIVVGNITVGGTGKTPLVIWLARLSAPAPGSGPALSRAATAATAADWPRRCDPIRDPGAVGDEPVLLARRRGCPVMADPDRVRAARPALLEAHGCNVIVSDDGLQHFALARDIEIAVIDGVRRFGNGRCLPAGPLREPVRRLRWCMTRVDAGAPASGRVRHATGGRTVSATASGPPAVTRPAVLSRPAGACASPASVIRPRFFELAAALGLDVIEHPFPDHHDFRPEDLRFGDTRPVIMTEKDAVKCERFADNHGWYLAVEANRICGWANGSVTA